MTTPFQFTADIRAQAGKPRRLSICGYTGNVMRVSGYGPIVVDLRGCELPSSCTVLADHDSTIGGVVGSAVPQVQNGQLLFAATCAKTEAAESVLSILESGVQLQASIGCEPIETQTIRDGETVSVNGRKITADATGFALITKSRLREITICPLGADAETSVAIAARKSKGKSMFKQMLLAAGKFTAEEIDQMDEKTAKAELKKCMSDGDEPEDDNPESKKADANFIVELMGEHCDKRIMAQAIQERWTVREVRRQALADLRASRPGPGVGVVPGNYYERGGYGRRQVDETLDAQTAAVLAKMGYHSFAEKTYGPRIMEASRDFTRMSMVDMMSASLQMRGITHDPRDVDSIIRASDGPSSTNVPNLLLNVQNKLLESQWIAAKPTWQPWCAVRSCKDFKPAMSLRPVFTGPLERVAPSGEITHGTIGDQAFSWQLMTYAKMYSIARHVLVNDDLSALGEAPVGLASAAMRTLSDLIYYTLMVDADGFFSSDHGNTQSGGGGALSASSLTVAIRQLRKQVSPSPQSSPLAIEPATLVIPPELEQTAKELLHSSFMFRDQASDRQGTFNPFQNMMSLQVEPRLSLGCTNPSTGATVSGSTTRWYLFGESGHVPAIVGGLNGPPIPVVQLAGQDHNFNVLGQSMRVYMDAGFALAEWRAAQNAPGA